MDERQPLSEGVTPGFVVWLTGLSGSGKSTLANALRSTLGADGIACVIIDSDELRRVLTPAPTFSSEERDWFYGAIGYLAKWLSDSGVNVLIAAAANRRAYRDDARRQIRRFAEVHVKCSLSVCQLRDPKGLYARAVASQRNHMPGMGSDYEAPLQPEIVVETDGVPVVQSACYVLERLRALGLIP